MKESIIIFAIIAFILLLAFLVLRRKREIEWPALRIVSIFVVIGPLVGLVLFLGSLSISESSKSFGNSLETVLFGLLAFWPFSYLFGGLQAFLVGTASGFYYRYAKSLPFYIPAIASVFVGLIYKPFVPKMWDLTANVSMNVSAAVVCWLLVKRTLSLEYNGSQSA